MLLYDNLTERRKNEGLKKRAFKLNGIGRWPVKFTSGLRLYDFVGTPEDDRTRSENSEETSRKLFSEIEQQPKKDTLSLPCLKAENLN